MLVVTVDLVPCGYEPHRRTIGSMRIANISNLANVSGYDVEATEGANPLSGKPPRNETCKVLAHDRRHAFWLFWRKHRRKSSRRISSNLNESTGGCYAAPSGLALAARIDHLAANQNNPDLRSLADCVRLVCLPLPRDASYFDDYRRVGKALVTAFQVVARQNQHALLCDLERFTFGWAALPACTDLLPRNAPAAASAAYLGSRIAEHRIVAAAVRARRKAREQL